MRCAICAFDVVRAACLKKGESEVTQTGMCLLQGSQSNTISCHSFFATDLKDVGVHRDRGVLVQGEQADTGSDFGTDSCV